MNALYTNLAGQDWMKRFPPRIGRFFMYCIKHASSKEADDQRTRPERLADFYRMWDALLLHIRRRECPDVVPSSPEWCPCRNWMNKDPDYNPDDNYDSDEEETPDERATDERECADELVELHLDG